jgi:hypothetical protein
MIAGRLPQSRPVQCIGEHVAAAQIDVYAHTLAPCPNRARGDDAGSIERQQRLPEMQQLPAGEAALERRLP